MESLGTLHRCSHPFHLSFVPRLPSFRTSFPSRAPRPPKSSAVSASSFEPLNQNPRNPSAPKPQQSLTPILKSACITLSAAVALFFVRFQLKPAIAAPVSSPLVEPSNRLEAPIEEQERNTEEQSGQYPNNVESLRSLMEIKIKAKKLQEAIQILNRLIELEPDEDEWPLLKANLYNYSGDFQLAKKAFEEILENDPLCVEAYHGLVISGSESGEELKGVLERIKAAMERCMKETKKSEVRDFKLLIAQVEAIEGNYGESLKVYDDLVKEEPKDFRPYLCQGIIYTLLRKKDEAEKKFRQYRDLVPENHPYAEFFDDNLLATKFFDQQVERESAGSRS